VRMGCRARCNWWGAAAVMRACCRWRRLWNGWCAVLWSRVCRAERVSEGLPAGGRFLASQRRSGRRRSPRCFRRCDQDVCCGAVAASGRGRAQHWRRATPKTTRAPPESTLQTSAVTTGHPVRCRNAVAAGLLVALARAAQRQGVWPGSEEGDGTPSFKRPILSLLPNNRTTEPKEDMAPEHKTHRRFWT
jgi:hypothetical protein